MEFHIVSIRRETASMANRIPTQVGDVLILETRRSFTTHAVGWVSENGEQDFHNLVKVKHVSDRAGAVAEAIGLRSPGDAIGSVRRRVAHRVSGNQGVVLRSI
jgi:hypothetical protein